MKTQPVDTEPSPDFPIYRKSGKQYIRLFYFMPDRHLEAMIKLDEIKATVPDECNDPLEFLSAEHEGKTEHATDCGFISFSSHFGSSLMWSHYADSHRGVCLQFDFPISQFGGIHVPNEENAHHLDDENAENEIPKITDYAILETNNSIAAEQFYLSFPKKYKDGITFVKVHYSQYRPTRATYAKQVVYRGGKILHLGLDTCVYTKSKEWEYEKEWRLLVDLDKVARFDKKAFFVTGLTQYITRIITGKKYAAREMLLRHYIIQAADCSPCDKSRKNLQNCMITRAQYHAQKYEITLE